MNQATLEISSICVSCDSCRLVCPEVAVVSDGRLYSIDPWSCTLCGLCIEVCPVDCIREVKTT